MRFFLFAAGTLCMTFDVMINTVYFKKCNEKKNFMTFTILVILSGVAEKSGKQFDSEYVILKNRAVSIHYTLGYFTCNLLYFHLNL